MLTSTECNNMRRYFGMMLMVTTASLIWSSTDACAQETTAPVTTRPTNSALAPDRPLASDRAAGYLNRVRKTSGPRVNGLSGDTAVRQPRRAVVRGIVGLAIGAAAGALVGYEFGRYDERNCVEECGISPRIGLSVGAILGGAIGFFVGLATTQ
jgi:hypothetical protein